MMNARRVALVAAVALGLAACTEVTQKDPPSSRVLASFKSPNVPAPADVALYGIPGLAQTAATAAQRPQRDFLQQFAAAGGFPNDQEVPVTFPIESKTWDGSNYVTAPTPPVVDLTTVNPSTLVFVKLEGTTATPVTVQTEFDPDDAADPYDVPTLRFRKPPAAGTGLRRWDAGGRYVVAIRGGASGVKLSDGTPLAPDTAVSVAILSPDKPLTARDNLPLLGAGLSASDIAGLEAVRANLWTKVAWGAAPCPASTGVTGTCWGYVPHPAPASTRTVADVIDDAFPISDLAAYATFTVAPAVDGAFVQIDGGSGAVPLPIDLLRTDADGTVITNPAFGAAAAGLTTLDGFSTTAMMLAQPSGPIDASTVTGANVFLYELGATPRRLNEYKLLAGTAGDVTTAEYIAQPPAIVTAQGAACPIAGGCSVAIGLQPAVPLSAQLSLPPLKSNTTYAVIVTDRVKGVDGKGLKRNTFTKILAELTASPFLPANPPAIPADRSLLSGVSADQARIIAGMWTALQPVWAALPAGTTKANVVAAYTFKTQTVQDVSLRLAAAPYGIEAGAGAAIFTPATADAVTPPAPIPNVAGWFDVRFKSVDGIDKATGAFRATLAADLANPTALLTDLRALVAVPNPANVTNNCPPPAAALKCAPLVIVGHGLNGSRETLFALANTLAAKGFVAAAIDFPLHGLRNWCKADADCTTDGVNPNGTCDKAGAFANSAGQGDAGTSTDPAVVNALRPGVCGNGSFPRIFDAPGDNTDSRYFVSANFFRIRDAFRQNVLDQSALGLALARPPLPLAPQPAANPFVTAAAGLGVAVDPTQIFYEGVSLGSIAGTQVAATNPRITRASLAVGGGTFADIAVNSPAFKPGLEPLFASLIPGFTWAKVTAGDPAFDPAIAAAYLRLFNVAKWVLDPGDPVNYALHVKRFPLPNLLTAATDDLQAAKSPLGLISNADAVVPNGQNFMLYNLMGADKVFYTSNLADGSVPHGIIGATSANLAGAAGEQVRNDAGDYLKSLTIPPPARQLTLQ